MKIYIYKNLAARGAPLTKFYFSKNHSGLKNEFLVENLQKITVALKLNVLVENLQIPFFYFKEKSPKRKFEIKNLNNIF